MSSRVMPLAGNSATPMLMVTGRETPAYWVLATAQAELVGHGGGTASLGGGENDGELLAAVAADHIDLAQMADEDGGNGAQNIVADHVPEVVVDLLEVIQIDHQDADAAAIAGGAGDLFDQAGVEIAAIEDAGESVAIGELAHAIDVAGVLGGGGQDVGNGFQGLNVIGQERFALGGDTDQESEIFSEGDQRKADLFAAVAVRW